MRYQADTDTTTFKCEGCGERYPASRLLWEVAKVPGAFYEDGWQIPGMKAWVCVNACSAACIALVAERTRGTTSADIKEKLARVS